MKVQDIFKTKAVKEIETEILDIYFDNEKHGMHNETEVYTIRRLLSIRKNILNDMFVLDDKYKQLLYDFNEALIGQLKEMRKRTLALYQATKDTCQYGSLEVDGKCLLGYAYSTIHPVQTMRAKKMLKRWQDEVFSLFELVFRQKSCIRPKGKRSLGVLS